MFAITVVTNLTIIIGTCKGL